MKNKYALQDEAYAFEILIQDVLLAINSLKDSDEAHLRRSTIRTIGAAIEGIIFHLKKISLTQAKSFPEIYSDLEIAALREETYFINDNGFVRTKPMMTPLKTSIKLIIKMIDKKSNSLHKISFNSAGWDALLANVIIRNKITHPKTIEDLKISKEEIEQSIRAFNWTLALALRAGDSIIKNLENHVDNLNGATKSPITEAI